MDLISVIVPIYNVEKYLNRCIESIVSQTYTDLEIILVDDGSTDGSPDICDRWAEKDHRIKVIHKPNGGLSDARNAGMAVAAGHYTAFVDSDDWLDAGIYTVLESVIRETGCDAAGCEYIRTDSPKSIVNNHSEHSAEVFNTENALEELIKDRKIKQVVWNKLYKTKLIKNIPFEKDKCNEDEFWSYLAIAACKKVAVAADYCGYYYFQRPDSIMGSSYSIKRLDAIEAKSRRLEFIKNNYPTLTDAAEINLITTCMYHGQLALNSLSKEERKKAFDILTQTVKNCHPSKAILKTLSPKQTAWILLALNNLEECCKIRHKLKIGL